MKTRSTIQQISTNIDDEGQNYDFNFSGKMALMLSDTLYSMKHRAIVREISTNAYDAQVEAGTEDKPFDVHLPTRDNPVFWVRDYGVGLSLEKLHDLYCTYGASSKEDTNSQTGCLGLGSKSPFCYHTRSFTVESYYYGIKYIIHNAISETGLPKHYVVGDEPTDEPNGLKVIVPCNPNDTGRFYNEANYLYKFFPVVPNIVNDDISLTLDEEVLAKGQDWKIVKSSNNASSVLAIMGNVAYPARATFNVFQTTVILYLYFNNGELDFTMSREELSFDSDGRTQARINDRLVRVEKEFIEQVEKELDNQPDLIEASKYFYENFYRNIHYNYREKFKYKGNELLCVNNFDLTLMAAKEYQRHSPRGKKITSIHFPALVNPNTKFFYQDTKIGCVIRCLEACKNGNRVILFATCEDAIQAAKISSQLCNVEIKPISSIAYAAMPKSRREKLSEVYTLKSGYAKTDCYYKTSIDDLDDTEEWYFLPIYKYDVMFGSKVIEPSVMSSFLKFLEHNYHFHYNVVCTRNADALPSWINPFFVELPNIVQSIKDNITTNLDEIKMLSFCENFSYKKDKLNTFCTQLAAKLGPTHDFTKVINAVELWDYSKFVSWRTLLANTYEHLRAIKYFKEFDYGTTLLEKAAAILEIPVPANEYSEALQNLLNKFPLLRFGFQEHCSQEEINDFYNYITK